MNFFSKNYKEEMLSTDVKVFGEILVFLYENLEGSGKNILNKMENILAKLLLNPVVLKLSRLFFKGHLIVEVHSSCEQEINACKCITYTAGTV